MEYKFVTKVIYDIPRLTMEFKEPYSMLTNIFMDIVLGSDNKIDWLKAIDDTIDGKLNNGDFGVQSGFGAEVGKEKTIIYCNHSDDEIELPTKEFKKLSETWFSKLEDFEKNRKIL